jgi:hypothetical protein
VLKDQLRTVQAEILYSEEWSKRWRKELARKDKLKNEVINRCDNLRRSVREVAIYNIFPTTRQILELPEVKALCEPEDAILDDATWNNALPAINELLKKHLEDHRAQTIRQILVANSPHGTLESSFSKEPADYPIDQYGDSFFSLATSALCCPSEDGKSLNVDAYPLAYQRNVRGTNRAQVRAIQHLLRSANLDPATATIDELRRKSDEGHWLWTNSPKIRERTLPLDFGTFVSRDLISSDSLRDC